MTADVPVRRRRWSPVPRAGSVRRWRTRSAKPVSRRSCVARRADRLEAARRRATTASRCSSPTSPTRRRSSERSAARIADRRRADRSGRQQRRVRHDGSFHELDPDRLDDEIELNVAALTRLVACRARVMVPRARVAAQRVERRQLPAGAAAGRVRRDQGVRHEFTESLHEEVRGTGVHVTALCPGLHVPSSSRSAAPTRYNEQVSAACLDCQPRRSLAAGSTTWSPARRCRCPGSLYKAMVRCRRPRAARSRAARCRGLVQRGRSGSRSGVVDGAELLQLVDAVAGVDQAHRAAARAHHEALRAGAAGVEPHASQQLRRR